MYQIAKRKFVYVTEKDQNLENVNVNTLQSAYLILSIKDFALFTNTLP